MEIRSQKIADLAGMFDDVDIEVVEEILDMCQGKVNKAAGLILKMKEDSEPHPISSEEEKKEMPTNDAFLEINENAEDERIKKQTGVVVEENDEIEQEYLAQMQKAIELSLESKNNIVKPQQNIKFKDKLKNIFKKKKTVQAENIKPTNIVNKHNEVLDIKPSPDEDVIYFVFLKKIATRGENISQIS